MKSTKSNHFSLKSLPIFLLFLAFLPISQSLTLAQGSSFSREAESAAAKRAKRFVEAVLVGDAANALQVLQSEFTAQTLNKPDGPDWNQLIAQLTKDCGGATILEINGYHNAKLMISTEGIATPCQFNFRYETEDPYKLSQLAVELVMDTDLDGLASTEEALLDLSQADPESFKDALHTYLEARTLEGSFSGVVGVYYEGQPRFEGSYGLADRTYKVPNQLKTRFDVGSITKHFTKIAIANLWIEGKLTLDDTIAKHLPDYPNQAVAQQVSLRQLLNHSSGIPDIFTDEFYDSAKRLYRTPSDFFPLFVDKPLEFEPGSDQKYSNSGYQILGAVIEQVTAMPYENYIQMVVFERAGMTRSGLFARDESIPDVAMGYTTRSADGPVDLHSNLFHLPVKGSPAGGSFSDLNDLAALDLSLRRFQLLPRSFTHWLFGGPEPSASQIAAARQKRSGTAPASLNGSFAGIGTAIAGGAPGVSSVIQIEGPWTVIVLSNLDPPTAPRLGEVIAASLPKP